LNAAVAEAKKAAEAFGQTEDARLKKTVDEMQVLADNAAKLYRENKKDSADAALDSMFQIAEKAGFITEFFIGVFAYNFTETAQDEPLLFALLERMIEFFPDSFTAYDLAADIHLSKGNKELALLYYRKVLELDPGNRKATRMVKDIQDRQ